jgi:hypothetical protein
MTTEQATHTPAPWRIEGEAEPMIVAGTGDDMKVIAYLPYAYETTGWTDQNQADADLLSAAPELLAALMAVHHKSYPTSHWSGLCWCHADDGAEPGEVHSARCQQAKDAIAKATGASA